MRIIDALGEPLAQDFNRAWFDVGQKLAALPPGASLTDDAPKGIQALAVHVPGSVFNTEEFEDLDEDTQQLVARFVFDAVQRTLGILVESARLIDLEPDQPEP